MRTKDMSTQTMPEAERPTRLDTFRELTAPLDWLSIGLRARTLQMAPKGDGRPIMLLPGYRASDRSMIPLSKFLKSKNYDVHHWGLGTNRGDIYEYVEAIGEQLSTKFSEPVTLIGWSLGGVIARELARLHEPMVREVITMGTPVIGGPKYTIAGDSFAKSQNIDLDEYEAYVHSINSIGLKQPITAFYSKRDGIVGWRAAVDSYNPQTRNIEVDRSHLGIAISADVWAEIAETLAAS